MRTRFRFPRRLVRWTSLSVCMTLALTSLAVIPVPVVNSRLIGWARAQNDPSNGNARQVTPALPEKRSPFANLPNLNDSKQNPQPSPEAPLPIFSSSRSRRKGLLPRNGLKVGDPATFLGTRIGAIRYRTPTGPNSDRVTVVSARLSAQTSASTAMDSSLLSSRKRHHATKPSMPPPTAVADDQYVRDFFQNVLVRQPVTNEQSYWNDVVRSSFPNGQGAKMFAAIELGRTLFESKAYAERGRSDHWYVYDLYCGYLRRCPLEGDGGWAFWENSVPVIGREAVRHAFEECTEFSDRVADIYQNGSLSGAQTSLITARVDPFNQSGDQMAARDCEWSVPLLSLPGRAGLDFGVTLSYSSLVWTRSGPTTNPYLYFDEDNGTPSPGFRLGFPVVQQRLIDAAAGGVRVYLFVSAGRRIELRQVGTSNVYEAADSSYLQLTDNGNSLLVRSTDGMQLTYAKYENEWRVTQVKDRNGNYLTVANNWWGDIATVTDTLGRVIYFNYDGYNNLTSITQNWSGWWRTLASFGWGANLNMDVSGLSGAQIVGTYQNESIPVLRQVGLLDGSYYTFGYTAAGQVNLITRYTYDNVERSHAAYDYNGATDDCPRLTQTRVSAENWTNVNGVPYEVTTQFSLPGDGSHQMSVVGDPNTTVYKKFYGSGWQKGLVTLSQVWSGGLQKWTSVSYTQDNTSVSYQTNPRVTETNVYDANGNRRRTTVDYTSYGLPTAVREWTGANADVLYRLTTTGYRLDGEYLNRRIIGLVDYMQVFDGATGALVSKVTYGYDWDWGGDMFQDTPAAATQHDRANYGPGLIYGRGNLSQVGRWDVNDPQNQNGTVVETKYRVNSTGSLLMVRDQLWHQTFISYGDSFSDSYNRNTFAYPTTLTDADGNNSYVQYNYDYGLKTRTQGPPPAAQSQGLIQTFSYDGALRIEQVTTFNTGAYTRFWHGPNYTGSFQSINNVADELFTNRIFDGLGRLIAIATNHPGSAGGYKAQWTKYDNMGRVNKQYNPTEIFWDWTPYGDDAGGAVYTAQTYDWKGRPLVTTNQDGTQKYASYAGCGCAGGEVVTLTDEVGRQQKVYNDVIGRTWKTEVLNWNGTVYSTTTNTFNARDQVTLVRQWTGQENGGGAYQDTTMSYDGHGRLQSKHVPEHRDQSGNPTYTTFAYNLDDTIQSVTDARGASATYSYNNRHLVTGISYSAPAGITPTSNVSFAYDGVGNRTSMTDGLGSQSYSYNQRSQMVSETRTFTGVGSFALNYDYNLGGELKKITDSTNMTINYGFDSTGRLSSVTGSDNIFMGISNYASNFQYRAWGQLRAVTDGNNRTSSFLYNSRLQPSHFEVGGNLVSQNYDYNNDGRISFVHNLTDANFDRAYFYDHLARLGGANTGGVARGDYGATPYNEGFGYDAFNNLNSRSTVSWDQDEMWDSAAYTNNRRSGWGYDADGRNTTIGTRTYNFDADGQMTLMTGQRWVANHYIPVSQALSYDGDGEMVKDVTTGITTYYLRSSVLEAIVEEINSGSQKTVGYVYSPDGNLLAKQTTGQYGSLAWKYMTPAGTSEYETYNNASYSSRTELDPMGASVPLDYVPPPEVQNEGDLGQTGGILDARWSNFFDLSAGCSTEGYSAACHGVMSPDQYLESQNRAFFDDRWYDLPGNNDERARAERVYVAMVQRTIAAYNSSHQAKKKPKLKPQKHPPRHLTPEEKRKLEEKRRRDAEKNGTSEEITVYLEQNDQRGGSYLNPCADEVFQALGFGKFINLDNVRIHIGIPDWVTYIAKKAGGIVPRAITWGNDIYFRSMADFDFSKENVVDTLSVLGHELEHVLQQRPWPKGYGDSVYLKYLMEWAGNGFRYGGKMEEQGQRVEDLLRQSIPQRFGNDPCARWRH